jgi:hypothetical protein
MPSAPIISPRAPVALIELVEVIPASSLFLLGVAGLSPRRS